jgi:hypothetical protein
MSQLERPETTMMLRGKAVTEESATRSRSSEVEGGVDLRGRPGTSGHAGLAAAAGYHQGAGSSQEQNDSHIDIYWGQTKNPSVEPRLRQRFRVEMGITRQQPEVFSASARAAKAASLAVAGWTGHRRHAEAWWRRNEPFTSRFPQQPEEGVVDGDVRVIVPEHLIVRGAPPPRGFPRSRGTDPVWESGEQRQTDRELVDLMVRHGHPWALPAATAVNHWAALPAAPGRERPDLGAAEHRRADITTVGGMLYDHFTNEVLMRLNMERLLRHQYVVPVGKEKVTVGLRINRMTPLSAPGTELLSRHYNQNREREEHLSGASRGLVTEFGPEAGADPEHGPELQGRLPFESGWETSEERAAESEEILSGTPSAPVRTATTRPTSTWWSPAATGGWRCGPATACTSCCPPPSPTRPPCAASCPPPTTNRLPPQAEVRRTRLACHCHDRLGGGGGRYRRSASVAGGRTMGAAGRGARFRDDVPGQHRGQRGASHPGPGPGSVTGRAAVDGQRVHPHPGGPDPARRLAR